MSGAKGLGIVDERTGRKLILITRNILLPMVKLLACSAER